MNMKKTIRTSILVAAGMSFLFSIYLWFMVSKDHYIEINAFSDLIPDSPWRKGPALFLNKILHHVSANALPVIIRHDLSRFSVPVEPYRGKNLQHMVHKLLVELGRLQLCLLVNKDPAVWSINHKSQQVPERGNCIDYNRMLFQYLQVKYPLMGLLHQ